LKNYLEAGKIVPVVANMKFAVNVSAVLRIAVSATLASMAGQDRKNAYFVKERRLDGVFIY